MDEINLRRDVARRQMKAGIIAGMKAVGLTYTGGKMVKDTIDTVSNIKDLYRWYSGEISTAELGRDKIKEDYWIDLPISQKDKRKLKSLGFKHRMPKKTKKGIVFTATGDAYVSNKGKQAKISFTKKKSRTTKKAPTGMAQKALAKKVIKLTKAVKADQAYHTRKEYTAVDLATTDGTMNQTFVASIPISSFESAVGNLRFFNPSVPGTLTVADASSGTYSRDIHFSSVYSGIEIRNNYMVPAKVKVYLAVPKQDTNISPLTYYSDGITDQVVAGGSATSPCLTPNEIDLVKESWSIKLLKNKELPPGKSFKVSHTVNDINYDPAMYDTHALAYQKKYKSFGFIVRIEGVLGHDTVADQQGIVKCAVDIQATKVWKITYDAGANLNDIYISDSRTSTFTTSGVTGVQPFIDNITYDKQ